MILFLWLLKHAVRANQHIIDIPTKSKKFSLFIKNLIDLKLAYYLKDSISLKNRKKALNDIDEVVKKIKKKIKF